jgi:hypothetical protein
MIVSYKTKININITDKPTKMRIPAITAAYAFTNYQSQGQNIEYMVVDLGKLACSELNGFNAYVGLSRSQVTPFTCCVKYDLRYS